MQGRDHKRLRWGILGTGNIATQFAENLIQSGTGQLTAVASRSIESAGRFIDEWSEGPTGGTNRPSPFGDYASLLTDPDLDAIYIALPNTLHFQWTAAALEAGKHVLCEKPLALSAAEAKTLFASAEEKGRILIEGFMYRAHPQTQLILETIAAGEIGEIQLIQLNFCFNRPASRDDARFRADRGGGSLMDVGCYCIDFARSLAGKEPTSFHFTAHEHELGVDDFAAGSIAFRDGPLASFVCGMTVTTDQVSRIYGTRGWIEIPRFWKAQEGFTLHRPNHSPEHRSVPGADGLPPLYAIEADAFAAVIAGAAHWNPPQNTIANLEIIEAMRGALEAK
ncbi:MAG: Gfo/Idh/MocA family oxidoreductase [Verrucomicrobiales bacterium]|nr:Gfo/Idh/MocA family oxidoreductase [Verrucomicrobiales bacterium]